MSSKLLHLVGAMTLVFPLACSESAANGGGGGGSAGNAGSGAGSGGANATGGMAGAAGTNLAGGGNASGGASGAGGAGAGGTSGSGGMAGNPGDDRLFVPDDLPNTELNGEGGLTLLAFTLVEEATGVALYAAVRNDGQDPACEAGMMTEFYDESDVLVTTTASTLQTSGLYLIDDGSGVHLACVPPGEIAMTASTGLPDSIVIAELGRLQHTFPAFEVPNIVPVNGFSLSGVEPVTAQGATAYTGTFTNELDVAVSNPRVTVFPVNRVGRPLGSATSSGTADVPAGGTWTFETGTVLDPGADHAAYASASVPQ